MSFVPRWRLRRGEPLLVGSVLVLGLAALVQARLEERRPAALGLRAPLELRVSSTADHGGGSLRQAILDADRAPTRARIAFDVERVVLEEPLPALVNPRGVVLDGGARGVAIEARGVLVGPAIDVAAPRSTLHAIAVTGAPATAVLVRAEGARLSRLEVSGCGVGVEAGPGVGGLVVEGSRFARNGTGVRLAGGGARMVVRDSRFTEHEDAAIWAVGSRPPRRAEPALSIRGNRFEGDRVSVVVGDVVARVEENHFADAREAAVYLLGAGAVVRGNRIRGGERFGVYADATDGAEISGNEIDHNRAAAILLASARATRVEANRVYRNGEGIATLFGGASRPNVVSENLLLAQERDGLLLVGDASLVERNRVLGGGRAGLRLVDLAPATGPPRASRPILEENVFARNRSDRPLRQVDRDDDFEEMPGAPAPTGAPEPGA